MPAQTEVVLLRQLASYLVTPLFLADPTGTLVFYNEAAETLLGRSFDEAGEMRMEEWSSLFPVSDEHGSTPAHGTLPLIVALREQQPVSRIIRISRPGRPASALQVLAFPLVGEGRKCLGAVALTWRIDEPSGTGGHSCSHLLVG